MDAADVIDIVLMVAGFATLVVGYRRDNRKIMLAAAILLFLSGALTGFTSGVVDGIADGMEQQQE